VAAKKAKQRPVFWIAGNYYDCQRQWKWIVEKLRDPNIVILDCGTASNRSVAGAADIIKLLKNRDMFDDRPRIVKLKGIPNDYTLLADYLKLVNNDNILVIDSPFGYYQAAGSGSRFISAKTSKFYKEIAKQGVQKAPKGATGVFDFPLEVKTDREAINWVKAVTKDRGKEIDAEAAELLVEQKGRNLDLLYAEITCLLDYQSGKTIAVDDVRAVSLPLFLQTVWNLIDQIDVQDYESAISHMQRFYAVAGSEVGHSFYGDVMMLLGALNQHFTFLMYLKAICGDDLTYSKAVAAVEGVKKRSKDGNKYVWKNDAFTTGFIAQNVRKSGIQAALRWPKDRLEDVFLDLCRTSFLCRTQYTSSETAVKICCDTFVMVACGILRPDHSAKIKGYRGWHGRAGV
jgi:hypothetical protein